MRTLAQLLEQARLHPDTPACAGALGQAYIHLRCPHDALVYFERARRLEPMAAAWHRGCAEALVELGRVEEAMAAYTTATRLEPEHAWTYVRLVDLAGEGDIDAEGARRLLVRSIALNPQPHDAYLLLARLALATGGGPEEAAATIDRWLGPLADASRTRAAVARSLAALGRYVEARDAFHHCLGDSPEDGYLLAELADVHVGLGAPDAARALFERAMRAAPGAPDIFAGYLTHLLRLGDLETAREAYRARVMRDAPLPRSMAIPPESAHPEWRGEPLAGKTILQRHGNGYGDAIQFNRFAALFRQAGATVVTECYPRLVPLLRTVGGMDVVVTPYEATPPIDYDVRPGLGALLMQWDWRSLPAAGSPWRVPAEAVARWRKRLGARGELRVGVTWRGEPMWRQDPHRYRSASLEAFRPLAGIPGVRLYAPDGDGGAERIAHASFPITRLAPKDFLETAALVQALDVIVTIDTAMAHLAGCLGKRCFVLLPRRACWRWQLDRQDSPWYPSMRLFRQTEPGDWRAPIQQVVDALIALPKARVASRAAASPATHVGV
jgi:tetratricopeptide (TPR) repeat protein